jgi:hypothetical protein
MLAPAMREIGNVTAAGMALVRAGDNRSEFEHSVRRTGKADRARLHPFLAAAERSIRAGGDSSRKAPPHIGEQEQVWRDDATIDRSFQ